MGREQAVYKVGSKPSFAVVQFLWTGWLRDPTEREKEIITRINRDRNRGNLESCCDKVSDKKPDPWGGYLIMKQRTACH